jgi:predicted nucleic acid-binding protein
MLCDAGPLVALIDRSDSNHRACSGVLVSLQTPLITTWSCLSEAMYLLGEWSGHFAQEKLWRLIEQGTVEIHLSSVRELARMHVLMKQYHDTPMDFADASLVAAAEALETTRVFTTDSHFRAYRINGKTQFEVVP